MIKNGVGGANTKTGLSFENKIDMALPQISNY